jgi:hypothetical protein
MYSHATKVKRLAKTRWAHAARGVPGRSAGIRNLVGRWTIPTSRRGSSGSAPERATPSLALRWCATRGLRLIRRGQAHPLYRRAARLVPQPVPDLGARPAAAPAPAAQRAHLHERVALSARRGRGERRYADRHAGRQRVPRPGPARIDRTSIMRSTTGSRILRASSGSRSASSSIEPFRSANSTVTCLRSPSRADLEVRILSARWLGV